MPAMVQVKCKCCKQLFMARVADRKRGWGRYCSKSCKAIKQEARTGQNASYQQRTFERESDEINRPLSQAEMADHGQWDD